MRKIEFKNDCQHAKLLNLKDLSRFAFINSIFHSKLFKKFKTNVWNVEKILIIGYAWNADM